MGELVDTTGTYREILAAIMEKQIRMTDDIKEIKYAVKAMDDCQRKFQLDYTEEHERVVGTSAMAHRRIDELMLWKSETDKRIMVMENTLVAQKTMNAILSFVSSVLGSAVIIYIWDLLVNH